MVTPPCGGSEIAVDSTSSSESDRDYDLKDNGRCNGLLISHHDWNSELEKILIGDILVPDIFRILYGS